MALVNEPPNVLLIITDDTGVDASNCYLLGGQQAKMPSIDTLCKQGMAFENAYSASVCSPTRTSVMNGQYGDRV